MRFCEPACGLAVRRRRGSLPGIFRASAKGKTGVCATRVIALCLFAASLWGQAVPVGIPGVDPLKPASPAAREAPKTATEKTPPASKTAAVLSPKDLKFPPLRAIQPPSLESATLPNGLRLYLLEDHRQPMIYGQALIRTGTVFDPPDKIGLAAITAGALRAGGTKSRTGDQIDRQLEVLAGAIDSGMNLTSATMSFTAWKENADQVMAIFRDLLTAPEFRQEKIDLVKTQVNSGIAKRNDDAGRILQREFAGVLYGRDTPYGWTEQYDTVGRIARADVQNFHKRYYFPKNTMIAVWGDFDSGPMKAKLTEFFGGWNSEQPPAGDFPMKKEPGAPGIYLAEKKDVKETYLAIGHLGGQLNDKDLPALEVAAGILGGGNRSRLAQRLRGRMANSGFVTARWNAEPDHPGVFQIAGTSDQISTVDAIKAIREELDKMKTAEVSDAELEVARDRALTNLAFALDSNAKLVPRLMTYEYYGYPKDSIQRYQKALASVTRADVLRVAKERFDTANLTIVVVGNPMMFGQGLESVNPLVNKLDLTIPEPKPRALKGDEASMAQGKQILLRAQQAAGGAPKLAAVKDYTEVSEFLITPENGGMKVLQTDRWIAPTTFRQDSTMQAGKISAYSDGRVGWIATPQGFGALGGSQLKQVQGDLFRLYFRLMLSDQFAERVVNALDSNTVEISDGQGEIADVEFSAATGLPARVRYDLAQATGAPLKVTEEYDDYREVAGVKIPHKITITRGGQKFADMTVTDYKINSGLQVPELAKRP